MIDNPPAQQQPLPKDALMESHEDSYEYPESLPMTRQETLPYIR